MPDISIIKFQLGGINFCIQSEQILEITRYTGVRKIPKPLPYVVGLLNLRKYLIVVVDFRKRLGLSPITLSKDTVMIAVRLSTGMTGLLVESISDFRHIPEDMILPPISIAGFPEHLLNGVLAEEDDIMLIPNLDKIFSSYLNIRLVPISPSEKIAFKYRFTPGSLTRTLESNLLNQLYLDHDMVRKLPRSLGLSSVLVHKMTSYYSGFRPRTHSVERKEQRHIIPQDLKAADAKYISLSQQFAPKQKSGIREDKTGVEKQKSKADIVSALIPDPDVPVAHLLGNLLHTDKGASLSSKEKTNTLMSHPDMGRSLAKTLKIPSTRVMKYFTYYKLSSAKPSSLEGEHLQLSLRRSSGQDSGQAPDDKLQELLEKNLPAKGEDAFACLLRTLQSLHDERYVLTKRHLEKICTYYHVSPVKIAKLASFFPEYSFVLEVEPPVDNAIPGNEDQGAKSEKQNSSSKEKISLHLECSSTSVSECIRYLAEKKKLSDDRYVRYVASQIRVPTCRLSKLRSYYRWSNEQIN